MCTVVPMVSRGQCTVGPELVISAYVMLPVDRIRSGECLLLG